jgi:hypothetical protein
MTPSDPRREAPVPSTAIAERSTIEAPSVFAAAVHQVLSLARGGAQRLLIEEIESTDWGRELPAALFDFGPFAESTPGPATNSKRLHTVLVALDEHGQRLASLVGKGWHAERLLPATLDWARRSHRWITWTRHQRPVLTLDGRRPLARPNATTVTLEHIARELSRRGWSVELTTQGLSATRASHGRDVAMLVFVLVVTALLFPLAALLWAYALVNKRVTGRWPFGDGVSAPWERVTDRVAIRCSPASLRVVRTQAERTLLDRSLDAHTLFAVFSSVSNHVDHPLSLIERDGLTRVPLSLRGDPPRKLEDQESGALLAAAIAIVWNAHHDPTIFAPPSVVSP